MLYTWQLWNALRYPPRQHVIFRRALRQRLSFQRVTKNYVYFIPLVLIALAFGLGLVFVPTAAFTVGVVLVLAFALAAIMMPVFIGAVLGAYWCSTIARQLAYEYLHRRLDLLTITPRGELGSLWLMALGILHRRDLLRPSHHVVRGASFAVLGLCGVVITVMTGLIPFEGGFAQLSGRYILVDVLIPTVTIATLIWLDYIQSITTATVFGILLATVFKNPTQAMLVTPILYVTLQVMTYLMLLILYLSLQAIMSELFESMRTGEAVAILLMIPVFYIVREAIIGVLLRVLLERLRLAPYDYEQMISAKPTN